MRSCDSAGLDKAAEDGWCREQSRQAELACLLNPRYRGEWLYSGAQVCGIKQRPMPKRCQRPPHRHIPSDLATRPRKYECEIAGGGERAVWVWVSNYVVVSAKSSLARFRQRMEWPGGVDWADHVQGRLGFPGYSGFSHLPLVYRAVDPDTVSVRLSCTARCPARSESQARRCHGPGDVAATDRHGRERTLLPAGLLAAGRTSRRDRLQVPPVSRSRFRRSTMSADRVKQKPRRSGAFRRADEGTRTLDLLHGKQTL